MSKKHHHGHHQLPSLNIGKVQSMLEESKQSLTSRHKSGQRWVPNTERHKHRTHNNHHSTHSNQHQHGHHPPDALMGEKKKKRHHRHRQYKQKQLPPPQMNPSLPSNGGQDPLTPSEVIRSMGSILTNHETGEILDYPKCYFIGKPNIKKIRTNLHAPNRGYDDERGDYNLVLNDHLAYRFELINVLGKGSFGQVLKCKDHKTGRQLAIKIIRNKRRFHQQALIELKVLKMLRDNDSNYSRHSIHMWDHFYFRNHLCIAFPLYSVNLYEFIKQNNFQGCSLSLVKRFAAQILDCLLYLNDLRIIHCDLKPENILLKQMGKAGIVVIDFGSSCLENETVYTYIQSRFYRAPEVILGLPYSFPIDMWSYGCILAELYSAFPIFPGENEIEQLACIMEVKNLPPAHMIHQSSRRRIFFHEDMSPRIEPNSRGKIRRPGTKDISSAIRCRDRHFVSFLNSCLHWDSNERFTPQQAAQHPWIASSMQSRTGSRSRQPTSSSPSTNSVSSRHSPHISETLAKISGAKKGRRNILPPANNNNANNSNNHGGSKKNNSTTNHHPLLQNKKENSVQQASHTNTHSEHTSSMLPPIQG